MKALLLQIPAMPNTEFCDGMNPKVSPTEVEVSLPAWSQRGTAGSRITYTSIKRMQWQIISAHDLSEGPSPHSIL